MRGEGSQGLSRKRCGRLLGESRPREPGLGTGRGGDVTGLANSFSSLQREVAVAGAARGSPSESHTLGSACDCRLTKR